MYNAGLFLDNKVTLNTHALYVPGAVASHSGVRTVHSEHLIMVLHL